MVQPFPKMAELFIKPIDKKDPKKPVWGGVPRVSITRPAVANEVDPAQPEAVCECQKQTRASFTVGTIVIILDGELKGKYGVVIAVKDAGILLVGGFGYAAQEFDQDILIATETKLEIGNVDAAGAEAAIEAAANKVPNMVDYLKSTFSLKKGDRPHLMKF